MYLNNGILFLAGINLSFAYDDLSSKKVASQSTTFPSLSDAYNAKYAVDRNIMTCMRTQLIGLNSPDKTVWWKVDLGGVYNIYSVNILFKNYDGKELRQRGRFAGFSLYVTQSMDNNRTSLCYKNEHELPSLNFTTTCITTGRYVTFYNERHDGVMYPTGYQNLVYTELCEIIVNGCQTSGVYGSNCNIPCPINCRFNTCNIQNGTCFGCKPGWTEIMCNTACTEGWFGLECKQQCSGHCRDDAVCNHVTGHCDSGCAAGWIDVLCDKVCMEGTYGFDCVNNCSGQCLYDSPCNKQTGHCDKGCKPGYTNKLCNEHCVPGKYGTGCENVCSAQCFSNKKCHPIDGTCSDGCQDGYIGKQCQDSCTEGYYGPNCTLVCSSNCKTCKPTDGTCRCDAGWRGPNCSIEYTSTSSLDSHLSASSSGLLGAFVCVSAIFTTALVIFVLRRKRKRLSHPKTKTSPYAEIGNHQSGDATYQELTVTGLDTTYENLALQ